jgi:hypothetical protein
MDKIQYLESRPLYPYFNQELKLFYKAMAKSSPSVGERHWSHMKDQYFYLEKAVWSAVLNYDDQQKVFQDFLKMGEIYIDNILSYIRINSHETPPEEELQILLQIISRWKENK